MKVDLKAVEDSSKELYIRALKILPPDIKEGFRRLLLGETSARAKQMLSTMTTNIDVAEANTNLLCQDTGVPVYYVKVGSNVQFNGRELIHAIRRGCERATLEHPLRSSIVHPITRKNNQNSCGIDVPVISFDFIDEPDVLEILMVPKGSGAENNSFLKMAVPAEGVNAIKEFVIDCVLAAGGKTCPPTIVGVGIGGTSELCVAMAKRAAIRSLDSVCTDPDGAALEHELSMAVNKLGVGPQGLGGDSTSFAVHIELAATHITMNPIAVNMQCHSARRASARFTPDNITYGF
ncbi:fumarate hydratase [Castellaniella sp.]|uniref:fumarate hydratase n=1 Tax=Castellaniella sp. TaxID=1955812 RepID=UPI003A93A8B6